LDLHLNYVQERFRVLRNELGHPTGVKLSREDTFAYLMLFPLFARQAHQLIDHFLKNKRIPA